MHKLAYVRASKGDGPVIAARGASGDGEHDFT
jgi:hypothetical protein